MRVAVVGGVFNAGRAANTHEHTPETTLADALESLGHEVIRLGHDNFAPGPGFDIVHIHHTGRAAYSYAALRSRPSPFVFTGHAGLMLCGEERSRTRQFAFRHVIREADALIALTHAEFGFLQSNTGSRTDIRVIPNGIRELYAQGSLEMARKDILFAGQLIPLKDVRTLLAAFSTSRLPYRGVRLRLAYHNATQEVELRKRADELGIAERVDFLGPLTAVRLRDEMGRARILALPSIAESRPSVIAEAHMAGTPVVASAVGGVNEIVGEYGTTVRQGDVNQWALALEVAYDTPWTLQLRQEMRARSVGLHSVEASARSHESLYETLLGEPKTHSKSSHRVSRSVFSAGTRLRYQRQIALTSPSATPPLFGQRAC